MCLRCFWGVVGFGSGRVLVCLGVVWSCCFCVFVVVGGSVVWVLFVVFVCGCVLGGVAFGFFFVVWFC